MDEERDLTPDEREDIAENPDETPEEARGEERYDANAGRLDRIERMLEGIATALETVSKRLDAVGAAVVYSGEDVTDDDDGETTTAVIDTDGDRIELPDFEDMDLTIK